MTRLLEWKQRMLQSPLTKKQNGRSSDTSSPLSHTSATLKNRSKSNLTAVNVATLSADYDGGSVRSHSSRGRKSRPATPSSDEGKSYFITLKKINFAMELLSNWPEDPRRTL
jgi:hypothetical protein